MMNQEQMYDSYPSCVLGGTPHPSRGSDPQRDSPEEKYIYVYILAKLKLL